MIRHVTQHPADLDPQRSGFIYHRKYLDIYSFELPEEARAMVAKHNNCEDILFNYMVANATGAGPTGMNSRPLPMFLS